MSQANVELVRQGYELVAAGEYEAVAALMAPEAEVGDSAGSPSRAALPAAARDAADAIVVAVRISGRGRTSGVPLDGAPGPPVGALRDDR